MSRTESRYSKLGLPAAIALLCVMPIGAASALDMSAGEAGWNGSWGASTSSSPLASSPKFREIGEPGGDVCSIAPRAPVSAAVGVQQGKSAAILGGMSALELMRNEQVTFARPTTGEKRTTTSTMAMAMSLEPAIGGYAVEQHDCDRGDQSAMMVKPGMNRLPSIAAPRSSDFLLSRRVPIGSTRFDSQWRRVSRSPLGSQHYNRIIGKRPVKGMELLGRVNSWVNNNISYVEDAQLWGAADYWATASQTLARARGDCEDLAIVKMKILERAGISREDMYLTVARDLYRNADHAFLVVKLGDRHYVLDNAVDRVLPADQDLGYRPILSFSGYRSWLHGY